MKAYRKNIFISAAAIILIGMFWVYKEANKEHDSLLNKKPQQIISAADIINQYELDENRANAEFLGKIVLITGPVFEINNQNDTLVSILINGKSDLHKINCLLDKDQIKKVRSFTTGKQISIQGICTGYLMDVELTRCVIVSKNEK